MLTFTYINTPELLKEFIKEIKDEKELAIDLECENNLHHFGVYLSLIQVSTREKNYVIDVLKLKEISPFLMILKDASITKIIHDVSFDLRVLVHQFNCHVKNVFDTQLAAYFLGKEKVGLGSLLEEYFSIEKERKFQRVDWTKRPLTVQMLEYAVKDTAYLFKLKEKLVQELSTKRRLKWVEQECTHFDQQDFSYREQEYIDVSGVKSLDPRIRGRFKVLFAWRMKIAQEVDKPVFKVISTKQLLAFAQRPPYDWRKVRGVHPAVKRYNAPLLKAVRSAAPDPYEHPPKKRLTPQQSEKLKALLQARNEYAHKLGMRGHLLLSTDQMRDVVLGKEGGLRKWQREIVHELGF